MNGLFAFFSSLALICATMVVRCRNEVHSVLFLILAFVSTSALLILVDLDFFAMVYLVVYVGAIAVLFLFVVMMLNLRRGVNESVLPYFPIGALIGLIFLFQVFSVLSDQFLPFLTQAKSFPHLSLLDHARLLITGVQSVIQDTKSAESPISAFFMGIGRTVRQNLAISESYGYISDIGLYTSWSEKMQPISNIEALAQVLYTWHFAYFLLASLILLIAMVGGITLTLNKGRQVHKQAIAEQNRRDPSRTAAKIRD